MSEGKPTPGPEAIEATIAAMVEAAKDWNIETLASRTVGLLILAEGNLNKYQSTLELVFEAHRRIVKAEGGSHV